VPLRDELEAVIRGWNTYELNREAVPVVDFDFRPDITDAVPIVSRLDAYTRCKQILRSAESAGEDRVAGRARSDVAYLGALLGERQEIGDYIEATLGCKATGWTDAYIRQRGELARNALAQLGIKWDAHTQEELRQLEGVITAEQAVDAIRQAADDLEPRIRELTGATAPYRLRIETVDIDAYWTYWLDGAGSDVRVRFNLRKARFTKASAVVFALHEILGHGLQSASFSQFCTQHEVDWVRLSSVHAQPQVMLEGLAQALPLFIVPDDELAIARVRLIHYTQLVLAELHLAINQGQSIEACVEQANNRIPFWENDALADAFTDRTTNPQLRTYLWSYPAGIDWFVHLSEAGEDPRRVMAAAYQQPLTPLDLVELGRTGRDARKRGSNLAT
jgi:hypothetical protein